MVPEGFTARMKALLGEEYPLFAASFERPRNVGLRLNPLKTDDFPALPQFSLRPVPWEKYGYYYDPASRPGLSAFHEAGLYYLQEPSAMAPAGLLDVRPGMRVLDLCAAPGGKSTQLAAALAGKGILIANEIHPQRAKILSRNLERCAAANAVVLNERPDRLAHRFPGWFDRILVDAPCSGEGMFRKEAAAVTDWSEQTVEMCAARQYEILCSAAQMLAPGGRLVYSTCTFAPQENEGVISRFLHAHPDFHTVKIENTHFAPGRPDWVEDPAPGLENTFRLWPHRLCGEGHFAAVLEKDDGGERGEIPLQKPDREPKEFTEFRKTLNAAVPDGNVLLFGTALCRVPELTPMLDGLRVLRAGLELGVSTKGRFEPAHAWALWLKTAASMADFPADSPEIAAYLRGETVPGTQKGWTLVCAGGLSLGWAKGSDGVLKNHFPKGLRHLPGTHSEKEEAL